MFAFTYIQYMLKVLTVFILLSYFAIALPPCRQVVYDSYILALTWPNQYCSENYCVRDWNSLWDHKSLIIHGLWPASVDLAYVTCLNENQYDPYCHQSFAYDDYLFSNKQIDEMRKYWPKLSNPRNFWSHEWIKHGTCYLDIIKNKQKSSLSYTNIFKSYYLQTVNKAKKLNIALTKGKVSTKSELAKMIKVQADNFYAVCGSDSELDEIRVCYSIAAEPGKEKIIKCHPSRDFNLCSFPIVIK